MLTGRTIANTDRVAVFPTPEIDDGPHTCFFRQKSHESEAHFALSKKLLCFGLEQNNYALAHAGKESIDIPQSFSGMYPPSISL